jgi:hypothetical protein
MGIDAQATTKEAGDEAICPLRLSSPWAPLANFTATCDLPLAVEPAPQAVQPASRSRWVLVVRG